MGFRKLLLGSLAATSVVSAADRAAAQEADGGAAFGDIVVTAQKRDENLQDVPVSVSAYTAEFRETTGIISTQDQMNFTPGVTYSATADRVAIRGVGRQTNQVGTDPGVAVYQDGFYVPSLAGVGGSTLGTERVEVLRGPQGTLYGRNSIGGAVNVISRRPGDELEREVRFGYNDYNRTTVEGRIAGPITETVSGSLRGIKVDQDDGYFTNVAGGPDEGGVVDSGGIDLQLAWTPNDRLDGWLRWNFNQYNNNDRDSNMISPYDARYILGNAPTPTYGLDPLSNPGLNDPREFATNRQAYQELDANHQITTEWNYAFDNVNVRYIGGYLQYDSRSAIDGERSARTDPILYPVVFQWDSSQLGDPNFNPTNNPAAFDSDLTVAGIQMEYVSMSGDVETGGSENKDAWSHEINFSSSGEGPLQWLFGLYHYEETIAQSFNITFPNDAAFGTPYDPACSPLLGPTFLFAATGNVYTPTDVAFICAGAFPSAQTNPLQDAFRYTTKLELQSSAAFAQFDYDFTDTLHATFGIRYTRDAKDGYETQRIPAWWPIGIAVGQTIDTNGSNNAGGVIVNPSPTPLIFNRSYDLGVPVSCPPGIYAVGACSVDPLNPFQGPAVRNLSDSWNMTTGTFGLQWTPSDETMVYFSYGRGAKSGGFNLGTFALEPVDVETIDAFEIGWKQDVTDRLRVNTAIFHYTYEGMQLPNQVVPFPGVSLPVLVNMEEVESIGAELEVQWAPTDNLQILANYSWLDSEITAGCCYIDAANPDGSYASPVNDTGLTDADGNVLQTLVGNQVPFSPEHKAAVNVTYTFNFAPGDLSLSATGNYRDDSYYTVFNTPDYFMEGYTTVDLRAMWRDSEDRFAVIGSVTNATDEEAVTSFTTTSPQTSRQSTIGLQPPRIYSVEFQYRF